ncbi:MAG: tRNA preQ1(34) S-adenosylmethionine ribosyltransferase-isomerase QueA [Chloroflexota bacterium]|nr:tRNA preQ1(34) S-adenosylmethionine ribosyltransferase-isomerase QueA [Chloroflexota bacterium]
MKTADFDYSLPRERIAQTPLEPRDASRLLVLHRDTGLLEHRVFREITDYLRPGDLLVANESRVIPARLFGHKAGSGGKVELLLLNRRDDLTWEALVRGRRVAVGATIEFAEQLSALVQAITETGSRLVRFDRAVEPFLDRLGVLPLPPYIHTKLADPGRYQTVYARVQGSAAAPTAGLHFTPELVARIQGMGVGFSCGTLHIGLDTFKPIQEESVEEHHIHTEYCLLPAETAQAVQRARSQGGRVIAVGTTAVRTLESAARLVDGEWRVEPFAGPTSLYIYPGYTFHAIDGMITNFHLPRSTLLCLVSAFTGKANMDGAYTEAIRLGYRFYSFGDAMLLL